jgi:5,10-methylenetetrahydrofolate reductase
MIVEVMAGCASRVFDLDGPRLASLAASVGLAPAVPEAPLAWPAAARPGRLVAKQACGASVAVLNHVPYPATVAAFVSAARAAGLTIPVLAAVAVYTDSASAATLEGLPGLELDADSLRRVLDAADPEREGIEVAVEEARALLAIEGVAGVNVSGLGSSRGWEAAATIKAAVGARIRAEVG